MADDDNDEVIVSLPGDTSTVTVTKVPVTETKKTVGPDDDPVIDLKNQFAQMTGRLSTVQAESQQTRQQLEETQQRLHHAETQVVNSQLDTVLSGIAAADAEAKNGEQAFVAAVEAGDALAQARAQRVIASAEARLQRFHEAKADIEDGIKQRPDPRQQRTQQPPQRQQQADPVERFAQGMSDRSAAWIRAHPDCVTDPKKNARMLAAHNLALADDVAVDSDEYFRRIEDGIKPVTKTEAKPAGGDGRRPSSAAAPATGGSGGLNGGGVEVRLTKREALSATDGTLVWNYDDPTGQKRWTKGEPIGVAEMARRKHEGMKNGLYDRMQYEA